MEPFDRDRVVALVEGGQASRCALLLDLLDAHATAGRHLDCPREPVVATAAVHRLGHRPAFACLHNYEPTDTARTSQGRRTRVPRSLRKHTRSVRRRFGP